VEKEDHSLLSFYKTRITMGAAKLCAYSGFVIRIRDSRFVAIHENSLFNRMDPPHYS